MVPNTISPSQTPTTVAPTVYSIPRSFNPFAITQVTNSATRNTVDERILVCPNEELTFSVGCAGSATACVGDTYLRLYDDAGLQLKFNDDSPTCGLCSSLLFDFNSQGSCKYYVLKQGCYSTGTCSGQTTISRATAVPSAAPTESIPAQLASYSTGLTADATRNTVDQNIYVCPGTKITFQTCKANKACDGDTFLRLYDPLALRELVSNDDACGTCSAMTYSFTQPCQYYTVQQGCFQDTNCDGTTNLVVTSSLLASQSAFTSTSTSTSTHTTQSAAPKLAEPAEEETKKTEDFIIQLPTDPSAPQRRLRSGSR